MDLLRIQDTKRKAMLIRDKAENLVHLAHANFGVKLPDFRIANDLRGAAGGLAYRKAGKYGIRLNVEVVENHFDYLLHVIIPHEVAHLVCFSEGWGKGHDAQWKRVCLGLGGNGLRTHDLPTTNTKAQRQFSYVTTTGRAVSLSTVRHNRIQGGARYRCKDGGEIHRECAWAQA